MERNKHKNMATTMLLAVVLIFVTQVDSSDMGIDSLGSHCPEGTVFCMQTFQCVNSLTPYTDPCPVSPDCKRNEVKQWSHLGYEQCLDHKIACGTYVCKHDGVLQCDYSGTCDRIEVSFTLSTPYDVFVDTPELVEDRIITQLSAAAGISPDAIWTLEIPADYYDPSVTIVKCNMSAETKSSVEELFAREDQIFVDANGLPVSVDWTMSWWQYHEAWGQYYDYGNDNEDYQGIVCGPDEVFCFLTFSCIKSDGQCPENKHCGEGMEECFYMNGTYSCVIPGKCYHDEGDYDYGDDHEDYPGIICGPNEVFCFETFSCRPSSGACPEIEDCYPGTEKCLKSDGTFDCVGVGQCNRVEVIITFNIYDFYGFVGSDYMNYDQQIEAITNSLIPADDIHYEMLWNPVLWQGNDSLIHFHCWAVEDLFDTLSSSIKANSLQLYDMNGQSISELINWSESKVYVQCGYRHEKCLQLDGTYVCVEAGQCNHVEVIITFNFYDFYGFVGSDYMNYDQQIEAITNSLIPAGDNHYGMLWNPVLWQGHDGLIHFHCWAVEDLFDFLSSSIKANSLQLSDMNGQSITGLINWSESTAYVQCGYRHQTCYQYGTIQCVDSLTCRHVEVYLVFNANEALSAALGSITYYDKLSMVIQSINENIGNIAGDNMFWNATLWEDNGATHFHCWAAEELNDALMELSTKGVYDVILSEVNWVESAIWLQDYSGGNYHDYHDYDDGDEEYEGMGIECDPNEVFCFETFSCRPSSGACPEIEDCYPGTEKCLKSDGTFDCVGVGQCNRVEVIITFNFYDFYGFVGSDYMNYDQQIEAITNSLIPADDIHYGMLWNPVLWQGNDSLIHFHCWAVEDLFDTLSSSIKANSLQLYDMNGQSISELINWSESKVYVQCGYRHEKCLQSDGTYVCVEEGQCNHVEVIITFNFYDFYGFVGSDYMNYDQQIEAITNSLIPAGDIHYGMLWNPVLWQGHDGLIHFHCWAVEDLFDFLSSSIKANSLQLSDMSGQSITGLINWSESTAYVQCGYRHQTCYQYGTIQCVDSLTCRHVEVYLVFNANEAISAALGSITYYDKLSMVIQSLNANIGNIAGDNMFWNATLWEDNGATHFHCWAAEELNDALMELSTKGVYDVILSEVNWEESAIWLQDYSGGNYHDYHDYNDGDEEYEGMGIECDPNEIFCFESNTCYNPDDPCSPDEPNICADGMEQCHDGTSQICVPLDTCEIIIVTIGLNVNYEDLVGVLSENYDTLVTALQMSLASQVGQPDIFWNINIGPATDTVTVFHATTSVAWYELVNQIITSEMLDVGLPINWEYTSVYNPYATTTDSFLLRFTVDLPEDNSISVTDVIEQHETIKTLVRYQVENAVGFGKLSTLVYYPAALYSTSMTVYAELNNIEFNVQQLLDDLVSANGVSLNIYDVNIITLPASSTNIYVLSAPVVANEEKSFSIEQVVSVGDVTSIGLFDCSATIDLQVKTGTLAYGSSVDVSKSDIITLKHSFTESAFVSCSVNFEGDEYFVGFLAIPYDITQMGEIEDISLTQESLDINEDSDWSELPSGIISSSMKGEHLYYMFNTWHEAMISNHERWMNFETETSLLSIFEDNALELFRAMLSNIESFRATVTTDLPLVNNVPTIQFRYRSKVSDEYTPMDETTGVNMLLDANLVSFKLKENYFGEFLLTISDVDRDLNLLLPVYVSEMFDRPTLNTDINRFEGNTDFAYPYEAQMSVPTYTIGDIVSIPFQNVDGYAMGMSVLGYVKSDTTITGTWEYSNDAGFTWNEINEAMPDENFKIYATLLNADDMIRFTPQPDVNWSIYKAPRLAFYAVEDTDEISNVVDTITFSECSVFADEEISRYCMDDERPSYSDNFVVLPLARYDCNGDLNEGMLELACGCGDATSCLDCGGVANGGQVEDICGDCGGTLTAINCTIEICSINRADFCDYISNVPDDSSGNACEDGYILRCGGCYLENEFLDEPCGVCGFDHCFDCNGVPDGTSLPNLCGGCSTPDMLSSDCATGIGNIQPAFVLYSEVEDFSMDITYPVLIEGFSCDLVPVENGDSISLSINSYDTLDSNTYVSSMTLLYDTTDKSTLIGKYNVVCDTGSETITSIEQFVVYGFPTVTSITPALADITELSYSYDITILGSGFVDTGAIYCIVPCSELDFDCDIPYVGAEGKFISESSVSCPVGKYKRYFRGQTYHVSVVLFDLESYLEMGNDISPDIELSNVEFTVTVPAPVAVSAVADKHGCKKIVVTFDIAVVVDTDDPSKCNDFLPDFDETARCKMMPDGDRNIVITYTGDTPSIESISVSNNKIKNADDKSNTPIYFTGSIPLTIGALSPSEQPIVEIAGSNSVGCFGTELKPVFKNLGCWEPVITWSVISDSIDTTLTDGLIIDQNKIVQYITPDKLYDGVTYTFTMNYVVGDVTGSKSIELSKGADAIPTLEFFGVNDKFDTTHSNVMKAYVYQCGNSLNANLKIDWFVKDVSTDTDILQGSGKTFNIQAHKLNSDYNYEITCTLTYSGGILVSTKTFSTASVPIDAKIYVDGINVQSKEMIANTEFYLACDDAKASDYDLSKYSCIWLCETNQYTDGESYLPCFDTDGNVWYEDGLTVTVPATPTENIPPHEYVRIFYLSMYRGETDPSYSEMKITYRPTPDTVKEPEIEIHSETHYEIIDKNAEITINVLCSKATRYSWQFNDGENRYGKPIMLIDQNGPLSGDISYHENKASECGMTLDLSNVDMVPEFQYYIKLTVDNQQPPYGRTESQIFTFKIMDIPVAGSLEVFSSEDPPIASTTSFKLVMYRWSEDVNFKCFCYYRSVSDNSLKRINAIQVSPSVGIPQFYLPEGEFDFRVDCIDDYGYSVSASSGTTITVQSQPPIDTSTFTASMELLPFHVSIEIETVITTVSSSVGLYNSVVGSGDSSIGSSEIESAHNILYQSTNIAISTAIDICYDDQISLVVVLEMSVDLVIQAGPTLIASSTKIKIVATAANIAYSALGYQDFGRRRKREVNTPSTAAGLDLETATSILNVFDTFLVNDTLDATIAEDIGDAIDDILKGLSMGYSGVTRIEAVSDEIYISVYKTDMTGLDTAQYDISSDTVSSNTIPGKVVFGPSVTDSQSDTWSCVYLANCTSIFIGVGIVTEDVYSRAIGVDAPTRISDVYIERLIDTLLFTFRSLDNLDQPIETTIFLYQQVNETAYNPKCMMWLDYTWDQSVCSTSDQAFDSETASYYVVCSCTQLGVLAVFQELKEMESLSITTTTTTTTSTTTSTTTPPLPSVPLQEDTDSVSITFSFVENFFDFLTSDAVEQADFTEHIEDQFVALTSYPPNSFQNWHVEEGSIVVSFDLYQSGSGQTLGQMVYVLEDLFSSGNITLTAPNGTVLTIIPGSFAYQEKSNSDGSSDDSSDDSSNSAALIGGIVAGVIIAILIAVIVILVLKQKGIIKIGSSSPHDDPPPRYEMPSPSFHVMPARPPPYLYDPVKQTKEQKWIENEVEKKVAEIKKEEEKRPISSSSGGKQETGLPIGDELEKENTVPSVSP